MVFDVIQGNLLALSKRVYLSEAGFFILVRQRDTLVRLGII